MTSFQSLTRGASTQHAIHGDNGGSKDRAPSSDSGFISDPGIDISKQTSDVNVSESTFSSWEVFELKKLVAQQPQCQQQQQEQQQEQRQLLLRRNRYYRNVQEQQEKQIEQLTQQNEQLAKQNQGLRDELRIFRREI